MSSASRGMCVSDLRVTTASAARATLPENAVTTPTDASLRTVRRGTIMKRDSWLEEPDGTPPRVAPRPLPGPDRPTSFGRNIATPERSRQAKRDRSDDRDEIPGMADGNATRGRRWGPNDPSLLAQRPLGVNKKKQNARFPRQLRAY